MNHSIQQFMGFGIGEIEKYMKNFMLDGFDLTNLEEKIYDQLLILGRNLMKEVIEELNENLKESEQRKQKWVVERNNEPKSLLTKFGWMTYHRTLFTSKSTQTSSYLVDDFLKESITGRMILGVARDVLEEAAQSSYQKGARNAGCQAQRCNRKGI